VTVVKWTLSENFTGFALHGDALDASRTAFLRHEYQTMLVVAQSKMPDACGLTCARPGIDERVASLSGGSEPKKLFLQL
jgi:hypothetical protein